MKTSGLLALWSLIMILLLTGGSLSYAQGAPTPELPASSQIVSQTGLLPVYGVDLSIDPNWVDGSAFPSTASEFPNHGVNATFQQLWDMLKPAGFNTIRYAVDVSDARKWAFRTANLCVWAAANGVRLVPVLVGGADSDLSKNSTEYVQTLAGALRADSTNTAAYGQILAFQIGDKPNHTGLHTGNSPDQVVTLILTAASALRTAEQEALKETGIYASPIMVNLSFDYELVKSKAMAGVALGDTAYEGARKSLQQFIQKLAAANEVDIINVEWLPGSVGAGSVDKVGQVLKDLRSDFGTKQFVFTTGFSTGFNRPSDQKNYYAAAFANLVQYRAEESAYGAFLGVFFREALDSFQPDLVPPSADLPSEMAKWDWAAKSAELVDMWRGEKDSPELSWWVRKTEGAMGLLTSAIDATGAAGYAPKPGFDALLAIADAVSEANTAMATETQPQSTADTGAVSVVSGDTSSGTGSSSVSYRSKLKEGLFGLIDRIFQKIGDKITALGTEGGGGAGDWSTASSMTMGSTYSSTDMTTPSAATTTGPSVSIGLAPADVKFSPTSPQVGQQVSATLTLHNQSPDTDATGLSVALVDQNGYVLDAGAQQSGINVIANSSKQVTLTWTPTQPESLSISAEVYDSSLAKVASAQVSLKVTGTSNGSTATPGTTASGDSAASVLPGSTVATSGVECAKSDIKIVPSAPTVGAAAKVRVTLHNKGSQNASGIDLLLVDRDADPSESLLAEVNGNAINKGSKKQIDINWIPTVTKNYKLAVQVWQGYTTMLAQVNLDPVNVGAAPSDNTPSSPSTPVGTLALKQVVIQPSSPKAGQNTNIKVTMKNESSGDVSNLDVYLVDSANTSVALAQVSVPQIAMGQEKSANLTWQPATQGQYEMEVQLWDAGGILARKPVDVMVTAPSDGSDGGSPGGVGSGSIGPSGGIVVKPDLTQLKPIPSKIPLPDPYPIIELAGPLVRKIPLGLPTVQEFTLGSPTPGLAIPVRLTLVNTFDKPVSNLKVTLMTDGKELETRSLSTMIPGQERSLTLGTIKLPKAGRHLLQVMLQGYAGKTLSGSVEREFNVSERLLAAAGAMASGKQPIARPTLLPAPLISSAAVASVRTVLPTTFNIAGKQVPAGVPPLTQAPPRALTGVQPVSASKTQLPQAAMTSSMPKVESRPVTTSGSAPVAANPTPAIPGVTPATATVPTAVPATTSPQTSQTVPAVVRPTIPTTTPGGQPTKNVPTIPGVTPSPTAATTPKPTTVTIPGVTPTASLPSPTTPTETKGQSPAVASGSAAPVSVRPTVPTVSPAAAVTPTTSAATNTTTPTAAQVTAPTAAQTVTPNVSSAPAVSAASGSSTAPGSATTPGAVRPTISSTPTSPASSPALTPTTPSVKPTAPTAAPTVVPTVTSTTSSPAGAATVPGVVPSATATVPAPTAPTVAPNVSTTPTAALPTAPSPTSITRATVVPIKPDLTVTPADISYSPSSPKAGEAVVFNIKVRNLAAAPAENARLICVLRADGAQVTRAEFPLNVAASGSLFQQWQVTTPRAKQILLEVAVVHSADALATNNQASVALRAEGTSR